MTRVIYVSRRAEERAMLRRLLAVPEGRVTPISIRQPRYGLFWLSLAFSLVLWAALIYGIWVAWPPLQSFVRVLMSR